MNQFANPHADEAQQRWPEKFAESQAKVSKLSPQQMQAFMQEHEDISIALASAKLSSIEVSDQAVQDLVQRHYNWICNFWTPDREAYLGLANMYVDDERFAANYNKHAEQLAEYLRDAIIASNLPN